MPDSVRQTAAQAYQVRHAAAQVVSALSSALAAAAFTLFVLMLVGWFVSGWATRGAAGFDFPGQWLYVLLPLLAASIALRISETRVRDGR